MKEGMKAGSKQSKRGKQSIGRRPQPDPELCAQKTERWFFYPNKREHPEYAAEARRQERSLDEFS